MQSALSEESLQFPDFAFGFFWVACVFGDDRTEVTSEHAFGGGEGVRDLSGGVKAESAHQCFIAGWLDAFLEGSKVAAIEDAPDVGTVGGGALGFHAVNGFGENVPGKGQVESGMSVFGEVGEFLFGNELDGKSGVIWSALASLRAADFRDDETGGGIDEENSKTSAGGIGATDEVAVEDLVDHEILKKVVNLMLG